MPITYTTPHIIEAHGGGHQQKCSTSRLMFGGIVFGIFSVVTEVKLGFTLFWCFFLLFFLFQRNEGVLQKQQRKNSSRKHDDKHATTNCTRIQPSFGWSTSRTVVVVVIGLLLFCFYFVVVAFWGPTTKSSLDRFIGSQKCGLHVSE